MSESAYDNPNARGATVEDAYRKAAEDEEADRREELGPNYFTNLARKHGFLPPEPEKPND